MSSKSFLFLSLLTLVFPTRKALAAGPLEPIARVERATERERNSLYATLRLRLDPRVATVLRRLNVEPERLDPLVRALPSAQEIMEFGALLDLLAEPLPVEAKVPGVLGQPDAPGSSSLEAARLVSAYLQLRLIRPRESCGISFSSIRQIAKNDAPLRVERIAAMMRDARHLLTTGAPGLERVETLDRALIVARARLIAHNVGGENEEATEALYLGPWSTQREVNRNKPVLNNYAWHLNDKLDPFALAHIQKRLRLQDNDAEIAAMNELVGALNPFASPSAHPQAAIIEAYLRLRALAPNHDCSMTFADVATLVRNGDAPAIAALSQRVLSARKDLEYLRPDHADEASWSREILDHALSWNP